MSYGQFTIAGIVAAIILFMFYAGRVSATKANVMSKFAMTILLDEFLYQQKRSEFLTLVETLKAENSAVLFYAAMFNLEDAAEKNSKTKLIGARMWQLNQRATQTGQSINAILESDLDSRSTNELYPNLKQNVSMAHTIMKIKTFIVTTRRRVSRFFGSK